jgi:hypothetical protein
MGRRATSLTNVTSNESWDTIGVPPIFVAFDYSNDRGTTSLGQASSECLPWMTRPQLVNGRALGVWKSKREKNHLVVMVEPFDQLTPDVWRGWEAETEDLAHYLGVKAMLRVTTPSR